MSGRATGRLQVQPPLHAAARPLTGRVDPIGESDQLKRDAIAVPFERGAAQAAARRRILRFRRAELVIQGEVLGKMPIFRFWDRGVAAETSAADEHIAAVGASPGRA